MLSLFHGLIICSQKSNAKLYFCRKIVRSRKNVAGIGAICDCLRRILHLRKVFDEHFINTHYKHRIDFIIIIKREVCMVNKKDQMCYIYDHPSFSDRLICSTVRYTKVLEEGEPSG